VHQVGNENKMELFESKITKTLLMVTQKEKLLTVNLISSLIQRLYDKFFTAHSVRKSHRQPQFNLQIMCQGRVLFFLVELRASIC
jgi:hypothetical protein